jgi:hypothetical protein
LRPRHAGICQSALNGYQSVATTLQHPGIPRAEDALLVIEVSESTLDYDRTVKLPRYAAAGDVIEVSALPGLLVRVDDVLA